MRPRGISRKKSIVLVVRNAMTDTWSPQAPPLRSVWIQGEMTQDLLDAGGILKESALATR